MTSHFYHQLYRILTIAALVLAIGLPTYSYGAHVQMRPTITAADSQNQQSTQRSDKYIYEKDTCPHRIVFTGTVNTQGLTKIGYKFDVDIARNRYGRTRAHAERLNNGRLFWYQLNGQSSYTVRQYFLIKKPRPSFYGWIKGEARFVVYLPRVPVSADRKSANTVGTISRHFQGIKSQPVKIWVYCGKPKITRIVYPRGSSCVRRGGTFMAYGRDLDRFKYNYIQVRPNTSHTTYLDTRGVTHDFIRFIIESSEQPISISGIFPIYFVKNTRGVITYPYIYRPGVRICGPIADRSITGPFQRRRKGRR